VPYAVWILESEPHKNLIKPSKTHWNISDVRIRIGRARTSYGGKSNDDSKVAIHFKESGISLTHPCYGTVSRIYSLVKRRSMVRWAHILRGEILG